LFNGYRNSVWGNEKVLEMDSDDDCIILWLYLMLIHVLPMIKNINTMLRLHKHTSMIDMGWGLGISDLFRAVPGSFLFALFNLLLWLHVSKPALPLF
jgi:hypothetical protein